MKNTGFFPVFFIFTKAGIVVNRNDIWVRYTTRMSRQKTHNTKTKQEIRKETRLTSPPRLEGKVKNAGIRQVRKKKRSDLVVS
jgi:hypothetical protein